MTRFLVTGAGGMLGQDLLTVLKNQPDAVVTALTRADLDVTDAATVDAAVAGHDVVLNAAAWTDVDGAETREAEATAVNGTGVAHLARASASSGARLVHVSTDYVFSGSGFRDLSGEAGPSPYPEDAPTDPLNAYGRSKLVGERAVLAAGGYVVRTAWLYGAHGPNFVHTMLRLAGERDHLDVVDDQRGQPTWAYALAERLVALALAPTAPAGVYHGTASGETTWYGLARAAFAHRGLDPARIRPTTSDRYPRPAPRPAYSVLGHARWTRAGLPPMADWESMLAAYLEVRPGV